MNERIRELAIEAGYTTDMFGVGHWDMPECKKFAELIVRECANMAESFHRHQYDFTGNLELHEFIKQHFGVEE
jgi:hypothetical protein